MELEVTSYVSRALLTGEVVLYETRLHRVIYLIPILLIIVGFVLMFCFTSVTNVALGLLLIPLGVILFISGYIRRATSEFVVTNKRVVAKTGWISRKTLELVLNKVESIDVSQGILARIFDFGRVVVIGTGGTREHFSMISKPIEFRRVVQNQQMS